MKLKGINPFEQHIEKIVLAGGVLAVGGVAAWQFINAPSTTFGSREVAPAEVDGLLEEKARALQSQLRGDSKIEIPSDGVAMAAPTFESAVAKEVAPAAQIVVRSPAFASALMKTHESSTDVWYYEPRLAALQMVDVVQTADALTPESAKQAAAVSPTLASRFSSEDGPKDVVWTTPVARLDLKGLRAELSRSDSAAKPPRAAIPGVWYQDTPYVVDVQFQRREVMADGSYGPAQAVPCFTSRDEELNFRGRLANATAELRDQVFGVLGSAANQAQVLQLPFYDTVNDAFVSPTVRSQADTAATDDPAANASNRRAMQLKTQLNSKKQSAQKVSDELTKLGGPWDDAKEREAEEERKRDERERKESEKGNQGGKGGGGFGMGGGGMDGRNQPGGKAEDEKRKREEARVMAERKSKTRVLRRLESEIAGIEKELGLTASGPVTSTEAKLPSVTTDEEVLVWGHDLEVEPGHTYQYRVVAQVYNPFFARGNQLVKEQDERELDQPITIASRESDWSRPVVVSPRVRFFVTQANAGSGQLGMGTAQVEVYRLVDGQWRRSEMQVQPGERIGRVDDRRSGGESIDFTTDFYVASIVEDLDQKPSGDRTRKPAIVVVRPLSGGPDEVRSPDADQNDSARIELRDQASMAAEQKDNAGTGTSGNPAGGSPTPPAGPGGPGGGGIGGGGGGLGGGSGGGKGR